jgi:ParB/RepB/Spo0J family partition protein
MSGELKCSGQLPPGELVPSPFNPRKTYPEESLRELGESMLRGQIQPVVVRPVGPKPKLTGGRWSGVDHFEIVAGHRRVRAALLVKMPKVDVTVLSLTDEEARVVQLAENARREGVPPSEEAAGVRELVALIGLEKTGERTGTPLARVRDLVRLASLPAWFLAAVDRGDAPVSTAAVVAKVPGESSRERAAACVLLGLHDPRHLDGGDWNDGEDWREAAANPTNTLDGGVLTSRDTKELIRTHFCRQLKAAPFSRRSLDLVADAGSCDACPKRAGNDPELAAEGVRADVCTDPECFEAKVAAYRQQELAKAAKGHGATAAGDVSWESWQTYPKGWCVLDSPVGRTELNDPANPWTGKKAERTVAELLGSCFPKGAPAQVAFHPKTGKPVLLVRTKDARRALQAAGLLDKPERVKNSAAAAKREETARAEDPAGPFSLYRVTIDPAAMPAVEFDALEGTDEEDLREQAVSAFVDWLDSVDWTAPGPQLVAYERVPEAEAGQLTPRSCRGCGCTEADCRQCVEKTGEPCHWVEADLCSACVPAAEAEELGHPEGEPIEALGVLLEDLQAVSHLCSTNTQKVAVKPVLVNGRGYVAAASSSGPWNRWRYWDLLPLHPEGEFADRHPGTPRRVKEGHVGGNRHHPAGWYGGLEVFTGRGRKVERWVVGVQGEQRRLLWVNPESHAPEVRTPAPPAGPLVCAPVGSAKLRDVPKFPGVVAGVLESVGVLTLSDLDARSAACRKQHRDTGVTPHNLLRTVEAEFGLTVSFNDLMAAGDALVDHLVVTPAPAAKGEKKGKVTK